MQNHIKNLSNDFLAQREADYRDVEHRLLLEITGQQQEVLHNWAPDQIAIYTRLHLPWLVLLLIIKFLPIVLNRVV